ncbi:hypothetical protein BDV40DRAFT_307227 [Aspergillus tamarii]|uniref:Uncharacterized protein n=1 Tax=Aspergillus tamarii TaxID=41984 RepID=A0A5N6VCH9_ASPTM|nr:hypothetical protein BDV40DRAFT_307227 [Aspergillus tamarii]
MDQQLSSKQIANLHEVADLMLEIYQTLANMRFLNPAGIIKGPHDINNVRELYKKLDLDPSIIYLYRILPYIDISLAGQTDFFQGSIFADYRQPEDIEQGRDPFHIMPGDDGYEDEDGPYMRPWVTALSIIGNHQSVIVYDARRHRIWIIDQESWDTTDPAIRGNPYRVDGEEYECGERSDNENSFQHIPSRPAGDVLRDIIRWYRSLEILPGGGENSGQEWDSDELPLRELYFKHGWPDNFNGEAFRVDQLRHAASIDESIQSRRHSDTQRQNGEDTTWN